MASSELTPEERARYARHLNLPGFGEPAQRKLKASRILIVGLGGLGSPAAMYLAAAGVGTLGLIEFDRVERSNLQRQIMYLDKDVGGSKLAVGSERLHYMNPNITLEAHDTRLSDSNAHDLISQYDLVLDGTDNFATRYLVNDACVMTSTPNIFASIFRFDAQLSIFSAPGGPCYRCLFPNPPAPNTVPSCAEGGVLGVLPGVAGAMQATEAIKFITGIGNSLVGRLLMMNLLTQENRSVLISPDPSCPVCGTHPTITKLKTIESTCDYPNLNEDPSIVSEISVQDLKIQMDSKVELHLIDVREPSEYSIARIPNSQLIPLGQLNERLHEFDQSSNIVVHCKMGGRSMQAAQLLANTGFKHVKSLKGGITAWSQEIDQTVPTY